MVRVCRETPPALPAEAEGRAQGNRPLPLGTFGHLGQIPGLKIPPSTKSSAMLMPEIGTRSEAELDPKAL